MTQGQLGILIGVITGFIAMYGLTAAVERKHNKKQQPKPRRNAEARA